RRRIPQGVPEEARPTRPAAHRVTGKRRPAGPQALGRTQHGHDRVRAWPFCSSPSGGHGHFRPCEWRQADPADLPQTRRGGSGPACQTGHKAGNGRENALSDAAERGKRHGDPCQCHGLLCRWKDRHLGESGRRAVLKDQSLDQFHRHPAGRQAPLSAAYHARRTARTARDPRLQHVRLECRPRRRKGHRARRAAPRHPPALRSAKGRSVAFGEREGDAVKLRDLLPEAAIDARKAAIDIAGLSADSRKVKSGYLFVAIAGAKADGTHFAKQAAAAGAAAVVAEQRPEGLPSSVAYIQVDNARRALALAAAKFYPRQPQTIAAVTGTSGKTSVAAFTRQIWSVLGFQAASIGTVGVVSPKGEQYGSLTTPDPVDLHRTLDQLAREGVTHLALEASSHGLDQHRLDGVRVAAGAFTNLTRDHLDYHPTIEAYLAAKLRLFDDLIAPGGTAVIGIDDCYAGQVVEAARKRDLKIISVGARGEDIRFVDGSIDGFAQIIAIAHAGRTYSVRLPLVGAFQVQNAGLAAGLAIATGAEPARVFAALEKLAGAKGRLELAGTHNGAPIFIDYAHKPDALKKVLESLRPYASGKLIVVFGAGGDRDTGKRPIMGRIAAENADRVVVTDDNPRGENPAAIRAAILANAPSATEIGDRAEAIRKTIAALKTGDVLLIAGKGHETGQIIGDRI